MRRNYCRERRNYRQERGEEEKKKKVSCFWKHCNQGGEILGIHTRIEMKNLKKW